jgi:hypothetical protein
MTLHICDVRSSSGRATRYDHDSHYHSSSSCIRFIGKTNAHIRHLKGERKEKKKLQIMKDPPQRALTSSVTQVTMAIAVAEFQL